MTKVPCHSTPDGMIYYDIPDLVDMGLMPKPKS